MLIQDDSVVRNMSVDGHFNGNLQRSSWKAEAIRRGDLKISGPIPITEDMPLNEEEERQFAEKENALSPSTPHDDLNQVVPTQQLPDPPQFPPPAPPVIQIEPQPRSPSQSPEEQPQVLIESQHSPLQHLPVRMQNTPERHRRSATEPISIGTPSPLLAPPETSTQLSNKKKRKSGLRNVFRKMFGRRSRDEDDEDDIQLPQRAQTQRQSQRSSDIGMMRSSSEKKPPIRRGRISDLDVEEPTLSNPLTQHLPFPMNVNAPQETGQSNDYLMFSSPTPELGRRRATLPNLLAATETQSLNGQQKNLETWDERPDGEIIPSQQIGIALSCSPNSQIVRQSTQSVQSKRKSRSAGNLRDMVKGNRLSVERRRSAEIRYWRSSFASGSVYSQQTPRPRTAQTIETVRDEEGKEDKDAAPDNEEFVTKSVPTYAPTVVSHHDHDHDVPHSQASVEAFNFGDLKSEFSDEESEEAAVATASAERRVSIEDRVRLLEENMRILDASVRRMSGRHSRQTIILENAPKGRRSRNRSSSASSQQRQSSHHSSRGSNNALQLRQYEDERPAPDSPTIQAPLLSAVTELPSTPLDAVPINIQDDKPKIETQTETQEEPALTTADPTAPLRSQLATLQHALAHERHARHLLESQVSSLTRDLADLQGLVHKFLNHAAATSPLSYPTPSPDAIVASTEEATTPRASGITRVGEARARSKSAGSGSQSRGGAGEVPVTPEEWATPLERGGFF